MYEALTKFIRPLEDGKFYRERDGGGYPSYSDTALDFMNAVERFAMECPESNLTAYGNILAAAGIEISSDSFAAVDIERQSADIVLAMLTSSMRAERIWEGAWNAVYESGVMLRILKRLKQIDEQVRQINP